MKIFLLNSAILIAIIANGQITFNVVSYPVESPPDLEIYIAGNFTGWDPGSEDYKLTDNLDGTFSITVNPAIGELQFKFTRGSWETVEGNEFGGYLPDRTYDYTGGPVILDIDIITWEDVSPGFSTAAENVYILDDSFYMPQLDRSRKIWIYLPPDYDTSADDFKVLYMQDGQNVFDVTTSFAGEWEVDETLNALFDAGDEGCIVVAIDNGGGERLNEYSPWEIPDYDVDGIGEYYIDFIVETLKPFVDANYRTKPEREFTGIMGSSMGALISMYGGVEHRETFSRIGAFSPSYWISDSCYIQVEETPHYAPMKIYSIAGTLEGTSMTDGVAEMDATLLDAGYSADELITTIHPDGMHSEWYWAREFGDAYLWLWGDATFTEQYFPITIQVYPNPAPEMLFIKTPFTEKIKSIKVFDFYGQLVMQFSENMQSINVVSLPSGNYLLQINIGDEVYTTHFMH
ncbi:MAG: alpha/beta hydrolase-fold protein [Chitinophagales bacterium]